MASLAHHNIHGHNIPQITTHMAGGHIPTYSSNVHTHKHAPNHNLQHQHAPNHNLQYQQHANPHTSYMSQQSILPQYTNIHAQKMGTYGVPSNPTYGNTNDPVMDALQTRLMGVEKTIQNLYISG